MSNADTTSTYDTDSYNDLSGGEISSGTTTSKASTPVGSVRHSPKHAVSPHLVNKVCRAHEYNRTQSNVSNGSANLIVVKPKENCVE